MNDCCFDSIQEIKIEAILGTVTVAFIEMEAV
jgi:hypothetical protein